MNIIAIIGLKNTGKTTLVAKIVEELVKRGYHVGTVKHSHHGFDLPGKDTWKHQDAGAELVVGSGKGTFFNFKDEMDIDSILNHMKFLEDLDYIVLEGFKDVKYAKISTSPLKDKYIIANVNVLEVDDEEIHSLVNLIEERSYGLIQEFNCKKCGYDNCEEYIKAKIIGHANNIQCKTESEEVLLKINNQMIPLNPFVRSFIDETVTGMVNSIKTEEFGVDQINRIELLIKK